MLFIKQIRKARGLTQEQLAERVGCSHPQMQRMESGKRSVSEQWLRKIANALEVHPTDLLDGGAFVEDAPPSERDLVEGFRGLAEPARAAALSAVKHPITAELVRNVVDATLAELARSGVLRTPEDGGLSEDAIALIATNIAVTCERLSIKPAADARAHAAQGAADHLAPMLALSGRGWPRSA